MPRGSAGATGRVAGPTSFEELLSKARDGSPRNLRELHRNITRYPENRSLEVVELALRFLPIDTVADNAPGTPLHRTIGDRGLACIWILLTCLLAFDTNPALKDATIGSIREAIDVICVWAHFCIFFGLGPPQSDRLETYNMVGRLLTEFFYHPSLSERLGASIAYHKLALRFWMLKSITDSAKPILEYDAVNILWIAVGEHGEAEKTELFVQQILAQPRPTKFVADFAARTIEHFHLVRDLLLQRRGRPQLTINSAWFLVRSINRMITTCESLRKSFLQADYLTQISSDLDAMTTILTQLNAHSIRGSLLRPAMELMRHIFDYTKPIRSVKNARDAIAGGILTHVFRIIAQNHEAFEEGSAIIAGIGCYLAYPDVILEVERMPPLDTSTKRALANNQSVSRLWFAFQLTAETSLRAYHRSAKSGVVICDNMSCMHAASMDLNSDSEQEYRSCAGCSSVVYCSSRCQRQDWGDRHRFECQLAHDDHARNRSAWSWYSHRSRAFHVAYIAYLYSIRYGTVLDGTEVALRRQIPSIDTSAIPMEHGSTSLVEEDDMWWRPPYGGPSQDYLKCRFSNLKSEYVSEGSDPTTRLVQAFFPLGFELGVYLTVKLEKRGEEYLGVYSIVKYASTTGDGPAGSSISDSDSEPGIITLSREEFD